VFSLRYGLNSYILFRRASASKGSLVKEINIGFNSKVKCRSSETAERETDQSLLFSAKVKKFSSLHLVRHTSSQRGALSKHRYDRYFLVMFREE
jgi:hypothetical protein